MSRDVSGPEPAREPDPERLREIWHNASPAFRIQLSPYDPDAAALADPDLYDTDNG
jgi:hypothetical protein